MQIIPELQLLSNKQRTHVHCVIKEGREEDLLTGSFLEDFPFHESWWDFFIWLSSRIKLPSELKIDMKNNKQLLNGQQPLAYMIT